MRLSVNAMVECNMLYTLNLMKRIFIILFALLPAFLHAGVIVKKNGDRLEDISIKSSAGSDIVYVDENGSEVTLPKSEVSAVLYDDGRYEEIKQESYTQTTTVIAVSEAVTNVVDAISEPQGGYTPAAMDDNGKQYNVYAYGVFTGVMGYISNEKYEDITVEYRVIYKSQTEEPEFYYLGKSPFAYVTDKMAENSFVGRGNEYLMSLIEPKPLVIPNDKDVKKIEFRLSKPGYKTVVVKPIKDVLIGCGPLLMISLDKLKPLKDGEMEDAPQINYAPAAAPVVVGAAVAEPAPIVDEEEPVKPSKKSKAAKAAPVVVAPVEPDYSEYQDGEIHKLSANKFYFVDSIYSKKNINSLVVQNCPAAQDYYKNAKKWVVGGWSGVAGSVAMIIVGSVLMPIGSSQMNSPSSGKSYWVDEYSYYDPYLSGMVTVLGHYETNYDNSSYDSGYGMMASGITFLTVGCAGLATSLTIACIGHHRMNNAYKIYNKSCAEKKEPALSLNFGPTRNGIGMTLNF